MTGIAVWCGFLKSDFFSIIPGFSLFGGGGLGLLDPMLPKVLDLACYWKSLGIVLGLVVGTDI